VHERNGALARGRLLLTSEVRQQVVAVDVHPERLPRRLVTLLPLLDDLWLAARRGEGRPPVVVLHDLVRDNAGRDLAGPAHDQRHAESAFPVRVLLATE